MSDASSPKRPHEESEEEDRPADKRTRRAPPPRQPLLPDGYLTNGVSAPTEHKPGAIRRIKLKNFVTYTSVEFYPGPSLNMVIGPNGTGKSTLVCAICIGLGYPPSLLGRAAQLHEFVKHGFNEARIEIEMQKPPKRASHPVFTCIIKREGNKATYSLDGKQYTVKQIKTRAEKLGVQIDNLCQFLPQDRVVEFSKMSDKELLNRTQRAVGSQQMLDWHAQLISTRKDQRQIEAAKEERDASLASLEAKHRMQEADVQRIRERDQIKSNIDLLESAKPFTRYRDAQRAHGERKKQLRELSDDIRNMELSVEPFLRELKAKESYKTSVDVAIAQRITKVEQKLVAVEDAGKAIDQLDGKAQEVENKRSSEKRTVTSAGTDIGRVSNIIRGLEAQLAQPAPVSQATIDGSTENIRRCEREKRALEESRYQDRQRYDELAKDKGTRKAEAERIQKRLEDLRSTRGQQIEKLKDMNQEAGRAYEWLRKNRNLFEKEVYGPPLVECSVKDPQLADIVEASVVRSDFQTFTTQTSNDYKLLQRSLRELGLVRVNQRQITAGLDKYRSQDEELRTYGLQGWILDLIEGPEAVLASLCEGSKIHKTAYSPHELSDAQFRGLQSSNLNRIITPRIQYQFTSRREYGPGASTVNTREFAKAKFWTDTPIDTSAGSDLRRRVSELTDEMNEIDAEMDTIRKEKSETVRTRVAQLDDEIKTLAESKKEMQRQLQSHMALPTRLQKAQEELESFRQKVNAYRDTDRELVREGDELAIQRTHLSLAYAGTVANLQSAHDGLQEAQIIGVEATSDVETLRERHAGITHELEEKRQERDQLSRVQTAGIATAKAILAEAKELNDQMDDNQRSAIKELQEKFPSLPALDAEIESETARLDLMQGDSHGSTIADYERRAKQIAKLKTEIEQQKLALEELSAIIATVRQQWEPKLDWLIEQISHSFSYNMGQINCAGEVGINKDEEDFDQWSIRIMVKFRESESLSQLDAHRQSGGERAVSTVFYLMSLQTLTKSPFRVVDEINQGMDPRNERLVHARMVAIATGTDDMPPPVMRMPRRRRQQEEDDEEEEGADGTQDAEDEEEDEEEEQADELLRQEELDALAEEHKGSQYFLITPKLLPDLKYQRGMRVLCIASGEHMPKAATNAVDFSRQLEIRKSMLGLAAG